MDSLDTLTSPATKSSLWKVWFWQEKGGGLTGCPLGDDNWENACPDGDQGNGNEEGGGDRSHDVRPHTTAVHNALEEGEATLEEGAVVVAQHYLEMTLQRRLLMSNPCTCHSISLKPKGQ